MAAQIKVRRGLKENLPTLAVGEFGFCTDTKELFIGTEEGNKFVPIGEHAFTLNDLTVGDVETATVNLAQGGAEQTGILFTKNSLFTADVKVNGEYAVIKGVPQGDWQWIRQETNYGYGLVSDTYTGGGYIDFLTSNDYDFAQGYIWDHEHMGPINPETGTIDIEITTYGEHFYVLNFEAYTKKETFNKEETFFKAHPSEFFLYARGTWNTTSTYNVNISAGHSAYSYWNYENFKNLTLFLDDKMVINSGVPINTVKYYFDPTDGFVVEDLVGGDKMLFKFVTVMREQLTGRNGIFEGVQMFRHYFPVKPKPQFELGVSDLAEVKAQTIKFTATDDGDRKGFPSSLFTQEKLRHATIRVNDTLVVDRGYATDTNLYTWVDRGQWGEDCFRLLEQYEGGQITFVYDDLAYANKGDIFVNLIDGFPSPLEIEITFHNYATHEALIMDPDRIEPNWRSDSLLSNYHALTEANLAKAIITLNDKLIFKDGDFVYSGADLNGVINFSGSDDIQIFDGDWGESGHIYYRGNSKGFISWMGTQAGWTPWTFPMRIKIIYVK